MRAYKLFIIYSFLQHHVSFKFNSEEVTRNERVSKFPSEKSERVGAFRRVVRHRERDATAKGGKERGRTTCGAVRHDTIQHRFRWHTANGMLRTRCRLYYTSV